MGDDDPAPVTTDENGAFVITGVAGGPHTLLVEGGGTRTEGWYAGSQPGGFTPEQALAETLDIAADRNGLDITLPDGFAIRGTVRSARGPLANINVQAIPATGTETDLHAKSVLSAANGTFAFEGLAPGAYVLLFTSTTRAAPGSTALLQDGFYSAGAKGHQSSLRSKATAIPVGPDRAGITVTLPAGHTVRGTFTRNDGRALAGFVMPVGAPHSGQMPTTSAKTGAYALRGLPNGAYRLWFQPDDRRLGPGGWFSNRTASHFTQSRTKATLVTVLHDRANISVRMPRLYTIAGTIRDAAGKPLPDATVSAGGSEATTDALGRYTIRGLVAGRYAVTIWPPRTGDEVRAWYSATASGHAAATAGAATRVTVGPSRTGINVRLPLGSSIAGCVTLPPGAEATVYAERPGVRAVPALELTDSWYAAPADPATGCYAITALPAGSWVIRVDTGAPAADGYYATATPTHYTADPAEATLVTVGP